MARWNYRLDVTTEWKQVKADEMELAKFCEIVVGKLDLLLSKMGLLDSMWLKEIRDKLDALAVDSFPDVDDFDDIWNDLYNWADRARCWVATF